ncbi:MAG: hypothetical protein ACRYHQ_11995 [Janthinobacterium lividum]
MQTHYPGSSLDELLADDMIQTMMDADHVNPAVVRSLFYALARTAGTRNAAAPATRPATSGGGGAIPGGGRGVIRMLCLGEAPAR